MNALDEEMSDVDVDEITGDRERWRVLAVHEAAHAVAYFVLRGEFCTVEISRWRGQTTAEPRSIPPGIATITFEDIGNGSGEAFRRFARQRTGSTNEQEALARAKTVVIAELEAHQKISLAGPIAEAKVTGRTLADIYATEGKCDRERWDIDCKRIADLRDVDPARELTRIEEETRAFVDAHWILIERVAGALAVTHRLSPRYMRRLLP